jgi:putative pyruvate formate lyase activating enzyme
LPNHIDDSKIILKTIKDNFGDKVWVSLMSQYYPTYHAKNFPEINRLLNQNEYEEIKNCYEQLNFSGGYFQELDSADKFFTPKFEITSLD